MKLHKSSAQPLIAKCLLLLTSLFALRVLAQLAQAVFDIPWLPAFEQWHSDTMPYSLLLAFQLLILWIMARQVSIFYTGKMTAHYTTGKYLLIFGVLYIASMIVRLVLGLTVLSQSRWFSNYLSTFFHFVPAGFVLTIGVYHFRKGEPASQKSFDITAWLIYPLVLVAGLVLHVVMSVWWALPLTLSTYTPIVVAAIVIGVLERIKPYQQSWLPNSEDIRNDSLYMGMVQLLLPKLVVITFLLFIIAPVQQYVTGLNSLWPHEWSIALQAILMLLAADFMRYWLHRWAHNNRILWKLHAVHHSPGKLYWLNVARFHPLEKALQMLFDALPFIFLGVSEQVIVVYFVFYAINGFFQHCNIQLKFGCLNYIVSSPELHRWHHSKLTQESNNNYGNNLIIWDLLFNSYFLPKDKSVGGLGLPDAMYPQDFVRQMKAPFVR